MLGHVLFNEFIYIIIVLSGGKSLLQLNPCYIIIIWILSILFYRISLEYTTMTYDEYKLFKALVRYKKDHKYKNEWFIVEKEFIESYEDAIAILQQLHTDGYIMDAASLIDTTTHSINLTPMGFYEYKHYMRKKAKQLICKFITTVISIIFGKAT